MQELTDTPDQPRDEKFYTRVLIDGPNRYMFHEDPAYYCHKPLGYAWFPSEIVPVPKSWVAKTGNLVWSKRHEKVRLPDPKVCESVC